MGGLSLYSVKRLETYITFSNLMDHSGFVIEKIYDLEKNIRDIDRTERGYMITRDTMFVRMINASIDSLRKNIFELKKLSTDNLDMQNSITLLSASVARRIHAARENLEYVDSSESSTPSPYYYASRTLMIDCSKQLRAIHTDENKRRAERYKAEIFYEQLTSRSVKWLLFVFCLVTLLLFILMVKELRARMHFQEELQAKIVDLRGASVELQEIAYVASHDLQEPLRKIQVFSDMLLYMKPGDNVAVQKENLTRINNSAKRIQSLISGLMSLTSLTKADEDSKELDLNRMVQFIILDMEPQILEKEAIVEVKLLPWIKGYENQVRVLLRSLIDNSLKFTRPGVRPIITISADITNGHELHDININLNHKKFHRICISDNGIGFEKQFISKMFSLFQRLHRNDDVYEGKGLGLAICRRVMANHEGYILAEGKPHLGATFKLFFPVA
jgi:signal transduction histidine kinase